MAKCKCFEPNCFYCVYGVDVVKMPKSKRQKKVKKKRTPEKCSRQLNSWVDGKPIYCKSLKRYKCHTCSAAICKSHSEFFRGEHLCMYCYDRYTTPIYPEFP